jgi:hypothetical protein
MDWSKDFNYHPQPQEYEISDWFFDREAEHLEIFQTYEWCPKLLDYSKEDRKIFLELDGKLLNHHIFKDNNIDEICPNWKEQVSAIIRDVENAGFFKIALYPHCFFLTESNVIKTIDFYSCVSEKDRFIPMSKISPIIGENSEYRYKESTVNDNLDTIQLYNITKEKHLDKVWHTNPLK